ncbi:alpha-N-arabinofuranosidase [Dokdonia sinensis]|uniref:Alpha-N-arabinofuranosidase n=1 Tax=Dokdonia sinensis TaxID=2479847 RepID=A0A3M0GT64_9FLAO|nr:glycoside hydrolase family 43 protein [Dokdonia sinensis]RMB60516.1 alpha-N-arabinofuranosidase [Dokdonia sinensis]
MKIKILSILCIIATLHIQCKEQKPSSAGADESDSISVEVFEFDKPIITEQYTADPSAHIFDGKMYIYPSHDYESGIPEDDLGNHFAMRDYHVYSMDSVGGKITDHGKVLDIDQVDWAHRQMWAPDAAEKDGMYYLYFPAKDKDDVFHIGVAVADNPAGPFKPESDYIEDSYSIDPSVFKDGGEYYMYFGGIWGGQLQWYRDNKFQGKRDVYPDDEKPALQPKIVKLAPDMKSFAEAPKDIAILDKDGELLKTLDNDRRFFEGAWVHKYKNTYYLSYSTGDTHNIVYATADNPYGPFTYQGKILNPVLGWTNHHSIVEQNGKWYLFYHDSCLSGGKTHLRSVKVAELKYNLDGTIQEMDKMVSVD